MMQCWHLARWLILRLGVLLLAVIEGCAPFLDQDPFSSSQPQTMHLSVPFLPDDSDHCGPVSLASVLLYWGDATSLEELTKEVYLGSIRGTLALDLLSAASARGFHTTSYRGDVDNIQAEIDAGHPLIVLLDPGFWIFSRGHFVVITGYDSRRGGVYVHSGTQPDLFISYERLFAGWNKTGRWTLRIIPKAKDEPI
jgi:ABC-type bacteriocin/lantibiotic exporter with double-glycine peptidase domain